MVLRIKALGADEINRRLARLPQQVTIALKATLKTEVDDLVAAMKRAAPDDPETGGSRIRDAIRSYPTPNRVISYRVISDAKDEKGHVIASHVEHGHKAEDGSHVPPKPSFFPTYRARKKGMKRRLSAAGRKALREALSE